MICLLITMKLVNYYWILFTVNKCQRLVDRIGTTQDSTDLTHQIQQLQHDSNELSKTTNTQLKNLTEAVRNSSPVQKVSLLASSIAFKSCIIWSRCRFRLHMYASMHTSDDSPFAKTIYFVELGHIRSLNRVGTKTTRLIYSVLRSIKSCLRYWSDHSTRWCLSSSP